MLYKYNKKDLSFNNLEEKTFFVWNHSQKSGADAEGFVFAVFLQKFEIEGLKAQSKVMVLAPALDVEDFDCVYPNKYSIRYKTDIILTDSAGVELNNQKELILKYLIQDGCLWCLDRSFVIESLKKESETESQSFLKDYYLVDQLRNREDDDDFDKVILCRRKDGWGLARYSMTTGNRIKGELFSKIKNHPLTQRDKDAYTFFKKNAFFIKPPYQWETKFEFSHSIICCDMLGNIFLGEDVE